MFQSSVFHVELLFFCAQDQPEAEVCQDQHSKNKPAGSTSSRSSTSYVTDAFKTSSKAASCGTILLNTSEFQHYPASLCAANRARYDVQCPQEFPDLRQNPSKASDLAATVDSPSKALRRGRSRLQKKRGE
jgi:hypothetical protein